MLRGSCHCRAIEIAFRTSRPPEELPLRGCTCSFCARHQGRYTSDAQGALELRVADPALLGRYRFGLQLADFLFCLRCGVFVAAFEPGEAPDRGIAVLNVNCLDESDRFTAAPTAMDYSAEDESSRKARRAKNWTPARIVAGEPFPAP